jgi:hypothetical protein
MTCICSTLKRTLPTTAKLFKIKVEELTPYTQDIAVADSARVFRISRTQREFFLITVPPLPASCYLSFGPEDRQLSFAITLSPIGVGVEQHGIPLAV